jgi:CRP-like cAMP-binding protein
MTTMAIFANDADTMAFPAGHCFFHEGEVGEVMYVVTEGEAEIKVHGKTVEVVAAGGIFGEMALIDHRERSADVIAKTETEVAIIDDERFHYLVRHDPAFALEVMKVMADRLRRLDDLL